MSVVPVDLKALAPYIKRAEELEKDGRPESSVVAYYCRQYAMELGIELRERATDPAAVGHYLLSLIEDLEGAKATLGVSRDEGEQIVYKFAMEVFGRADAEDRNGSAGKATARTFYAASLFMEALKQFGDRGDEVDEKCRYAKWKAADILKAIKEGRAPTPGGPNEDGADKSDAERGPTVHDIPAAPSSIPAAPTSEPTFPEPTFPEPTSQPPSYSEFSLPKIDPSSTTTTTPPASEKPPTSSQQQPPTSSHSTMRPSPADPGPPQVPQQQPPVVPRQPPPVSQVQQPPRVQEPAPRPTYVRRGHETGPTDAQVDDALEYARFAVAALEIKDTNLAIQRLQGALAVLQS